MRINSHISFIVTFAIAFTVIVRLGLWIIHSIPYIQDFPAMTWKETILLSVVISVIVDMMNSLPKKKKI